MRDYRLPRLPDKPAPFSRAPCSKARAAALDRLADAELQHGHHHAAEFLAGLAAELRGAA
jgi:hypothetical protein